MRKRGTITTIMRKCLKCDIEFRAVGRLNRVCPACHEKNKEFFDTARYQAMLRSA
jgi:hypothetical protein